MIKIIGEKEPTMKVAVSECDGVISVSFNFPDCERPHTHYYNLSLKQAEEVRDELTKVLAHE